MSFFNPLNTELNPNCHLLALLGAHHILDVGRISVNICSLVGWLSNGDGETSLQSGN